MAETCPLCGEPLLAGADACPNCGDRLRRTTPSADVRPATGNSADDDARTLADELTALETLAEAEAEAIDRTLGELEAVEEAVEEVEERLEEAKTLEDFVRRVEATVVAQATQAPAPPRRRGGAAASLVVGSVIGLVGLFLMPESRVVGGLILVAGFSIAAISGAYYVRATRQ